MPLGGQNILEPAAWGKTVFYGPHMGNFLDARQLLETAGCGVMVRDRHDLLARLRYSLAHPQEVVAMGREGRTALSDQHAIAAKQAELIRETLDGAQRIAHSA